MNQSPNPSPVSPDPGAHRPKPLDQVREVIRLKHYSDRTEDAYVGWIRRFILFHNKRHPAEMGAEQVKQFLSHLALHRHVAASTQNQAFNALLFLYHQVLHIDLGTILGTVRAKKPQRLPVVLTPEEVQAMLALLEGTPWLVCRLLYGSGLRLQEALELRVQDVDFTRMEVLVRDGKGQKDRVTMLPVKVESALRDHLAMVRRQHELDLAEGRGRVPLPAALARLTLTNRVRPGGICRGFPVGYPVPNGPQSCGISRSIKTIFPPGIFRLFRSDIPGPAQRAMHENCLTGSVLRR